MRSPFGVKTTIVEAGFFRTELFRTELLVGDASAIWPDLDIDDYAERRRENARDAMKLACGCRRGDRSAPLQQ